MAGDENMRRIAPLCLGLGVSVALVAPALAELAMTGTPVVMRAGPTGRARIIEHIPRNAKIEVGKYAGGWRHVSWRGRFGYIPAESLITGPPLAASPGDKMPPPLIDAGPAGAARPAWRWTGPYIGLDGAFGSGSQ
jgi:hypothetical protein